MQDKLAEANTKINNMKQQQRDDIILNAISDLRTELKGDINKLDTKIDTVKKDLESKMTQKSK